MTVADIGALLTNPSPEQRADLTQRVARSFSDKTFSGNEAQIALDILRRMAADAEIMVRSVLALEVRQAEGLPRDLAHAIARDVDTVSAPFLESTPVLSDDDLVSLLKGGSALKQAAIARRPVVSETLSEAILDTGNVDAVAALAGNKGAALSEQQMGRMLDEYGADARVNEPLTLRAALPVTIAERLVNLVSERLKEHILTHHAVSSDLAADLLLEARERVTLSLSGEAKGDLPGLVTQLYLGGRLTPSIVLRAACMGDLAFVEESLARLANVPVEKAYVLLHDAGPLGLQALYQRTGLPESLMPAFRAAIEVMRDTAMDGEDLDQVRFSRRVLERVLTWAEQASAGPDTDYLLAQLTRLQSLMAGSRLKQVAAAG